MSTQAKYTFKPTGTDTHTGRTGEADTWAGALEGCRALAEYGGYEKLLIEDHDKDDPAVWIYHASWIEDVV